MPRAYYNELDKDAAQWLRNLIKAGLIAPGDVDDRSIEDVRPADLAGYTQCHFFAGIGVWSHALRRAGWPDSRPVWTASCPCQPFSQAGQGDGFADERHLWPALFHLIEQRRPDICFGEQVASPDGLDWLDLVQADLEAANYSSGAVDLCAAGVGAPHWRQRTYWMADADQFAGRQGGPIDSGRDHGSNAGTRAGLGGGVVPGGTDPLHGHWAGADWLGCRDGKWRPVEPGYEQMADGSAGSLGRVRPDDIKGIEEAVQEWEKRHKVDAAKTMRRVWEDLRAEAISEREVGRFSGVQSPAVLLAFMRQLSGQGWRFADTLACAGATVPQAVVRILRFDSDAARTPLRRELEEQRPGQPADPVRELSSIVACHAAQCWGDACRKKASAASFPRAIDAPARVVRLRAYGNAIVAPLAEEFIRAYLEACGC